MNFAPALQESTSLLKSAILDEMQTMMDGSGTGGGNNTHNNNNANTTYPVSDEKENAAEG